ncbi:MAG: glutamate-cysteine ligase family protein, partial [Pseudomonadota bacterium]|nr:glutamate-cysteine ligase family protein [Pseudomonadota bacterium]
MKKNIELSSQIPTELDLINYFHSGSKSSEDYKIGTENEKFLFHKESLCPLQYSDGPGIVDVFKILMDQFHWSPIFDGDNVIGLSDAQNDRNISLEPGGQIELSGSKCSNLHQTNEEFKQYHSQIEYVCNELNIGALGLGFSPKWGFKDMAKVPKTRYTIMREYMPKVGSHGLDMMH